MMSYRCVPVPGTAEDGASDSAYGAGGELIVNNADSGADDDSEEADLRMLQAVAPTYNGSYVSNGSSAVDTTLGPMIIQSPIEVRSDVDLVADLYGATTHSNAAGGFHHGNDVASTTAAKPAFKTVTLAGFVRVWERQGDSDRVRPAPTQRSETI